MRHVEIREQCGLALLTVAVLICVSVPCPASAGQTGDLPERSDAAPEENQRPARQKQTKITISRETTRLTAPLDERGYVDYVEALNQQMSKGITPETNAAVPIWRALGPGPMPEGNRAELFRRIGIAPLPVEGEYFVDLHEFVRRQSTGSGPAPNSLRIKEKEYKLEDLLSYTAQTPWQAADYPLIDEWLKVNAAPLELVSEGTRRPRAYIPYTVEAGREAESSLVTAIPLPAAQKARTIVRAFCSRAMLHLSRGQVDDAHRDLMTSHRLANHIGSGASLIEKLAGLGCHAITYQGEVALAASGKLSAEQARRFRTELEALDISADILTAFDTLERYIYLDSVQRIARYGPEPVLAAFGVRGRALSRNLALNRDVSRLVLNGVVDWDVTLKMGNDFFDEVITMARLPDPSERRRALDRKMDEIKKMRARISPGSIAGMFLKDFFSGRSPRHTHGKILGSLFLAVMGPPAPVLQLAEDRVMARTNITRTAYALAAFHAEHDRYPDSLSELVPGNIAHLPTDPFAGKPLRYQRRGEHYLLYSVGDNGRDDNGADRESDPRGDDIVIRAAGLQP